jgi:RNA polymerase sigma factor (sigma-70 family)
MEEEELIRQAQQGDAHAFRLLVERYAEVVWRTARVLVADRAADEDVLQEAWLDAWRGLTTFQIGRPFAPWLLAVVANRCRMSARRRTIPSISLTTDADTLAGEDTALDALLRREGEAELTAALATLPADQRRVVELRYFAELDLAEIASVLGIPLGTVKSRLHRALLGVRLRLSSDDPAPLTEGR